MTSCIKQAHQYGKAIISPFQLIYENEDSYQPHDHFMASDMMEKPVEIIVNNKLLTISNTFNDGFTGHNVKIDLTPELHISSVKYNEWSDVEDGSNTEYSVEKIILTLNTNPFQDSLITGYYSLQIRNEYNAGRLLKTAGANDTTYYSVKNGKFKIYSKEAIRKGKDWVNNQNELKYRIKDSLGVYQQVDEFAKFQLGDSILNRILNRLQLERNQTNESTKSFVTLSFTVNDSGSVDTKSLKIREGIISNEVINKIKREKELWANWKPAVYKGRKVKSEVNLPIRIKN